MTKTKKEILIAILKREMAKPEYKEYLEYRARKEAPVIKDLRAHGIDVERLHNLRPTHPQFKSAVPILAEWVAKLEDPSEKEGMVRMLSVRAARGLVGNVLFAEFNKADSEKTVKWAIGNALAVVSTENDLPRLLAIAKAKQNGTSRQMVVLGLKRYNVPEVRKLLVDLLNDDDVVAHAISALGNLRAAEATPALTGLLTHRRSLVRRSAKAALEKIEKSVRKEN